MDSRLAYEEATIRKMIALYCRRHHQQQSLCPHCTELLDYAQKRLSKCPFGDQKPVCAKCSIHCYQGSKRENIKEVMRKTRMAMLVRHPLLSIRHLHQTFLG